MSSRITIKELLDDRFNRVSRTTTGPLKVHEICAEDFLKFAMNDSKGRNLRSWVNALGNVKRAIECRVDSLLYNYCLHKKSEKERWNFPTKIEIIQQLGIIAPRILKKINKKRNELEHRYVKPTEADVDDALDIATLFLAYTNELANQPIISYGVRDDFTVELKRKEGIIKLIDHANKIKKNAKIDDEDEMIEFAKRLSGCQQSYFKQPRIAINANHI